MGWHMPPVVSSMPHKSQLKGQIKCAHGQGGPVYGTHAKQLDIYYDLVEPLVKNVLAGYNCTLFAYGQTSTGKTFTMEGEQIISAHEHSWNEDSSVGIVPRALQHIFTELENQDAEEFSVRVSYVELYNEELYDLLGNAELGHARLRLFEDSVRKGSVIVSGLEEVPVSDRLEVRELLKRGAEKRRTAMTQMNLNSSRSHTVFTITVVIRENTVSGEEVIKQGKLSLIDLAGSENIGRSGSIDKRAREAGSINQSLLTLGRVIMALTSGAGHVPYRESKLTRILQDSLGGKTITTIVATLSPASTNIEESISTLEYASTAKNIKNQPEINQKLTHRALLRAYNDEMNRLMRDLQAARDKTGFFVDRQNYENMNMQLAQQSQQIETLTDELQSVLERIQLLMQDAELLGQHYGRLYERYKHMEQKYKERCDENAQLNLELADCKSNLENHRSVLTKLQESANRSQSENRQLRQNCSHLDWELDRTHDKIDVFRNAANENEKLYLQCTTCSAQSADKLKKGVEDWNDMIQSEMKRIMDCCERTKSNVEEDMHTFRNYTELLRSQLSEFFTGCEGGTDNSVISFLKEVCVFINGAESYHEKLYEQHNRFIDFVMKHVEEYELRGKSYYEVSTNYTNFTVSVAEKMKHMVTDALETYIETTRNETQQVNDKLKSLRAEQQSAFERQCIYVKTTIDETCPNKTAWESFRHDFSKKITSQREYVDDTHKTMEALCRDLQKQGDVVSARMNEMANLNTDVAMHQIEVSGVASSSLLQEVNEAHSRTKQFFERNIIRPSSTGKTPVRRKQVALPEPVEIPDANELINKTNESEVPRRLSQYRPRDSILETSFAILSPGALRETLKCDLDEIIEVPEDGNECGGAAVRKQNDSALNITKRRRAFQSRNS
ncbi:kinesin motor domain-containing protein [Loa loa]|nr:kinesin motor domain-containing protein [Loa loa]EJD76732.1 kinesin motor domain-containing protein [Loa loa]